MIILDLAFLCALLYLIFALCAAIGRGLAWGVIWTYVLYREFRYGDGASYAPRREQGRKESPWRTR